MGRNSRAFLKALSAVLANLSGAWFTIAFVTPNFSNLPLAETMIVLTKDILLGIVFLLSSALIEKYL